MTFNKKSAVQTDGEVQFKATETNFVLGTKMYTKI